MKPRIILVIFAFLILHFTFIIGLQAQDTWEHEYDPFNMDGYRGHDVIKCTDGGYIVNGSCYVEDPQNPGINLENYGFTMKVDVDGNLEWVKKDTVSFIPLNEGSALVQTSDGGFVTAVIPYLAGQGALIKRDADGNREWAINLGLWVHSIANSQDGNFVIVGGDYEYLVFQKLAISGDTVWTKMFTDTNLKSVYKTQDGEFLLAGYIGEEGISDKDVFVAKTDTNGDTLWTRTHDGFGDWDQGNCVIEKANNEILLVGESHESNFRTIHGLIWNLDGLGHTNWLKYTDSDFGWAHWSVAEYQNSSCIAFCAFNYDGKFYGFDDNYNILWKMEGIGGAIGDRCFCVDGEYIVWPEEGSSFILYKAIPDQHSVDNNIINKDKFLLSNYPNPFNPSTMISYHIPKPGMINIAIYNLRGQKIKTLIDEYKHRGSYNVDWNGKNNDNRVVGSGVYFVNLSANSRIQETHKIILMK